MCVESGRLITNFSRAALLGSAAHVRPTSLPNVTQGQLEALDMVELIGKATQLEIPTQAGDMHFINNLAILHSRGAFTDGQQPHVKRHLVRMRLDDDDAGWAVPMHLKQEWSAAFGHHRARVWHLEPMPDGFFPLRSHPN
ncbi:hypothetical protein CDD83_1805 [Cordyceps sp. RAO-2017]|nr:hypothetical protein CDD83_1805 [Cordyceps sp. RAO-2017]